MSPSSDKNCPLAGPPGATADRSVRHSSGVPGARERSGSSGSRTADTATATASPSAAGARLRPFFRASRGNPVVDPKLYFAVVVQVATADARIERQIVVARGELGAVERLAASGRLPVECVAVPARQTAAYVAVGDQLVACPSRIRGQAATGTGTSSSRIWRGRRRRPAGAPPQSPVGGSRFLPASSRAWPSQRSIRG